MDWRSVILWCRTLPPKILLACLAVCLQITFLYAVENSAVADRAWQVILEQASGPGTNFRGQDEALAAARQHLDKQEASLREFVRQFPEDTRHYSAQIRLAAVLTAQSRVRHDDALYQSAQKSLTDLEGDPNTPGSVKSDAGFARVSQAMEHVIGQIDETNRTALLRTVRDFDASYPGDRRTGNLLTEISTLYDDQPAQKKALLEEALGRTKDETVRARIGDDLKRVAFLGHPVPITIRPFSVGESIDLAQRRGRVQVVLFWASFSLPALHELAALEQIATQFEGQPVDFSTVSVDEDRARLGETIKAASLKWPTHYDGRGWKGELVRSLGINTLPTVWVLDRRGNLLSINARGEEAETIRKALAQP